MWVWTLECLDWTPALLFSRNTSRNSTKKLSSILEIEKKTLRPRSLLHGTRVQVPGACGSLTVPSARLTSQEGRCHNPQKTTHTRRCSAPVHDYIRLSSSQHIYSAYNRQWNKIKKNIGFGDAYGAGFGLSLAIM